MLQIIAERKKLGALIRAAREEMGLSQEALAWYLGYSSYTPIGKIERGEQSVTVEQLIIIHRVLGKPLSYFLPTLHEVAEDHPRLQEVMVLFVQLSEERQEWWLRHLRIDVKEERESKGSS